MRRVASDQDGSSVQIDPKAAQVVMETAAGAELALDPGKQVVARVVQASADGAAKISLAGQILAVQTSAPLNAGDEIRLSVTQASATTVQLAVMPNLPPTTMPSDADALPQPAVLVPTNGSVQQQLTGSRAVIAELAKLGVPVDPTITDAVSKVVEHLGGGSTAARAVAQLASRDLVLSSAAATRVAAALEVAGKLGPELERLAAQAPVVAAAIPTSAPSAAALRNVLAPVLEPAELAIARIVQAGESAAKVAGAGAGAAAAQLSVASAAQGAGANGAQGAPGQQAAAQNAPTAEAANAALRSYTSAKLAASGVAVPDSGATRAPATPAPAAQPAPTSAVTAPPVGAPATQAQQAVRAALIGTSAAAQSAVTSDSTLGDTQPLFAPSSPVPGSLRAAADAPGAAASLRAPGTGDQPPLPAAAQRTSATAASATAATGTATALGTPTPAPVADAVADLATLAARIAPNSGPAQGVAAQAASQQGQGTNATQIAQNAGAQGAAGTSQASANGAAASGDPRPIVTAVTQFLASGGTDAERAQLLRTLAASDTRTIAAAVRQLPESDAMRFAGAMLESLPDAHGATVRGGAADILRQDVHRALDDLGRALAHARPHEAQDELASLRSALQQVASSDTRPAVAQDAARLLGALDGQQVLSRTQTGADAGFLYFQVPLPDGRGAEVVVRRDPARRTVTFDEFNIAFLLDTERLGTLMIQLDAHPNGIRADVKTDVPVLQPFLEAQSAALVEPLARESRRPVTVSVGSFDSAPPSSLLEPQLGVVAPGTTEYYA